MKKQPMGSVLGETAQPTVHPEVRVPAGGLEKALLILGEIFSVWLIICTVAEVFGLWSRANGEYRSYSFLLAGALLLYLAALVTVCFEKIRLFSVFASLVAAVIGIFSGVSLGSASRLGYINNLGQTFTETTAFWWGHIIPAVIFLLCLAWWGFAAARRKKEDSLYVTMLAENARKRKD
ncbi:MAG: hypothetical protein IJC85_05515 [Oscillospiraceae bacterium]|nr:hypothetical protein [Oscillospiraceae bacterium]